MIDDNRDRGCLYVVATPIGNLEDITIRALRVLRESDLILAEDTRRTLGLLNHHGIVGPRLRAFHAHSGRAVVEGVLERLARGERVALVTDAGTPIVSDPGAELVAAARAQGLRVEAVPGPSAVLTALCTSGIAGPRFRFAGFLPRAGKKRRDALERIARDTDTVVFFEAPSRLSETLRELAARLEGREVAVCRELTKVHEEVVRGTAEELAARFVEVRGEVTVVVAPCPLESDAEPLDEEDLKTMVNSLLDRGETARTAADVVARTYGLSRREAYRRVLAVRGAGATGGEAGG